MEYKQIKTPESFSFNRVAGHQVYGLLKAEQSFGYGIILINYRFDLSKKQKIKYKTKKTHHNFAVWFHASEWLHLTHLHQTHGRKKSLPFVDIWSLYLDNHYRILKWEKVNN